MKGLPIFLIQAGGAVSVRRAARFIMRFREIPRYEQKPKWRCFFEMARSRVSRGFTKRSRDGYKNMGLL